MCHNEIIAEAVVHNSKLLMNHIKPCSYSYPTFSNKRIIILGAGNVTKSLLLVASLLRPNLKFKVIARSNRSAELIRQFLNDLPKIDVVVVYHPIVPDLSNQLVVLTIGKRTAKFSRRNKKKHLYKKNQELVKTIIPQLSSSVVIVVTNPSTAITKFLTEEGINAYGIGVANDQLRFNNQTGENLSNNYFVGAHNFHELIIGSRHSIDRTKFLFTHADYKKILAKQDKKIISKKNLPHSLLDFKWSTLEKVNSGFPPEYRWYARQRIHSKFHDTSISCSLATLNTICFFQKKVPLYNNFSLEMPLYLTSLNYDTVIGWPIDGESMLPLELTFDYPEMEKLETIASKYKLNQSNGKLSTLFFKSPFGDYISITAINQNLIHSFFQKRLAHLFSISRILSNKNKLLARIIILENQKLIDDVINNTEQKNWITIPQHRGKNPQEHTNLEILTVNDQSRVIKFPHENSFCLIEDEKQEISFYTENIENLFHEMRRVIRDEIAVPTLVSRGARILHAGILNFKGLTILIIGPSGGGKTTAVLSLISTDKHSKYGSSERTLIWTKDEKIMGLGIPESVTVFPGTLKNIPEFQEYAYEIKQEDLWNRRNKSRLQMDEILNRTNTNAIQYQTSIDLIIEVEYDKNIKEAVTAKITDYQERKRTMFRNDLTEKDSVRLPWLNWYSKNYNNELYTFINNELEIDIYSIKWSNAHSLHSEIIDIIAKKKLYEEDKNNAQVQV